MRKFFVCIVLGFIMFIGNVVLLLWMCDVQILLDGIEIVFCYKGDIYKVFVGGGIVIQFIIQFLYECIFIWLFDSK